MREAPTTPDHVSTVAGDALKPVSVSWWTTYKALLRMQMAQVGAMLPLILVVQTMLAAGVVIGFGLLIPDIDDATALFLSTGAPTILLIVVGMVIVPQAVAQARMNGTFTYMRSLPVPRPLVLAADLTLWAVVALPGVVVSVLVAWFRYGVSFSFDWPLLIISALLVTLMSTAVGYGVAVVFPPMIAQLLTQVIVFFAMLFSPIAFPAAQLPAWFQTLHDVLPLRPGADLLRAGLASDVYSAEVVDLFVLAAWAMLGLAVTLRALVRRG